MKGMALCLAHQNEVDSVNQLLDEALTCVGSNKARLLDLKLLTVTMLVVDGQNLQALELLQVILPEAKAYTANHSFYHSTLTQMAGAFFALGRYQEAHEATAEKVALDKANYGLESLRTLTTMNMYASICFRLGRVEEAKEYFDDVLIIETRVFGRDYPLTQATLGQMRIYGFAELSG